eukprot:8764184-Prorocentrum_lima.AAC.1
MGFPAKGGRRCRGEGRPLEFLRVQRETYECNLLGDDLKHADEFCFVGSDEQDVVHEDDFSNGDSVKAPSHGRSIPSCFGASQRFV